MIRGTLFLLGIIGAAIFAFYGHFDRGGAESRLGPEASLKVERLAKAAVRELLRDRLGRRGDLRRARWDRLGPGG